MHLANVEWEQYRPNTHQINTNVFHCRLAGIVIPPEIYRTLSLADRYWPLNGGEYSVVPLQLYNCQMHWKMLTFLVRIMVKIHILESKNK